MKTLRESSGLTKLTNLLMLNVIFLAASPVHADIAPPIKIMIPPDRLVAAVSGQEYFGMIEIKVGANGQLADFQLSGRGWEITRLDTPDFVDVVADQSHIVEFRATPTDASQPLHFSVAFDGRPVTRRLNLSPEYLDKPGKPRAIVSVDAQGRISPFHPVLSEASNVAGGQTIRFYGRIAYMRPTALGGPQDFQAGADGIWFEIMDEDDIVDETIYSGHTNTDGFFDVTVEWDDCDALGCDKPDVYIRYETDTGVVNVQESDILEEDYSWSSEDNVIPNFEGNEISFGTLMPSDWDTHAPLHILTNVTRAHRFILDHSGVNVEEVDVRWPDSNDEYNPFFEEIHISSEDQWSDGTIVHEYGHHYVNLYAEYNYSDYCNGICDIDNPFPEPDDCGHCVWCEETNHDAWNEGFPDWLAAAVMARTQNDYHVSPLIKNDYMLESLQNCGTLPAAADVTEGFLAALLVDIDDGGPDNGGPTAQDDHSGGTMQCNDNPANFDCIRDALALGPEEILEVTRLFKPTNPLDFIEKFRTRFPQHVQDFWSTATNVSTVYSFAPPPPEILDQTFECKMNIAGQPLSLNVQANGSALRYQWRKAGIDVANNTGISGARCSMLNFSALTPAHAGVYEARVTTCDQSQFADSDPIRVTVFPSRGAGTPAAGFGSNNLGQLGNSIVGPDTYTFPTATPLTGLTDVVQISSADFASLALRSDGTVWAWGIRRFGPDSGAGQFTTVPEQVPGLADVIQVAAGGMWGWGHNLALKADGTVWGWADNGVGQLGLGNFSGAPLPVQVPIDCVVAIAAGAQFSLFLKSDGTVWAAGRNTAGQLGRSTGYAFVPEIGQVEFVSDVTAIAAGMEHALALRSDGTVYSWGRNGEGQLGRGLNFEWTNVASLVYGLSNVTVVAAGGLHSMAILSDQTARTWGANHWGQLGNGGGLNQNLPVQPVGLPGVRDTTGGANHTAFVATNGTLWTVGSNNYGEGGHQFSTQVVPVQVPQIANVLDVEAGEVQTFVLNAGVPPSIILQPISQTVLVGQPVQLTIAVLSVPAPHIYQWRRNGTSITDGGAITGATTPTLSIDSVTATMAGIYAIEIYNSFGSAVSVPVTLTVNCPNGDGDCDGRIDEVDTAGLADCIGGPFGPRPPECEAIPFGNFDANNDGDVDLRDAAIMLRCFAGEDFIDPACGQ